MGVPAEPLGAAKKVLALWEGVATTCPLALVPTTEVDAGSDAPFTFATVGFGKLLLRSPPAVPFGGRADGVPLTCEYAIWAQPALPLTAMLVAYCPLVQAVGAAASAVAVVAFPVVF